MYILYMVKPPAAPRRVQPILSSKSCSAKGLWGLSFRGPPRPRSRDFWPLPIRTWPGGRAPQANLSREPGCRPGSIKVVISRPCVGYKGGPCSYLHARGSLCIPHV